MKTLLLLFLLCPFLVVSAQITSPVVRANFGVDGDLRANSFNGSIQSSDDWFSNGTPGTGQFIIDTTGAAAIVSRYATDVASRQLPFYRVMRFAPYSVVNNRLLIDGVFIRDYHGNDSTVFSVSNKNGQSPADWQTPVSQSVPDKNDIKDMMVHLRRAGPSRTDSLWMMGGVSIIGTTGNRYFDFEMYQTDIFYQRSTRRFINYGPDAGHTSWILDANGNIITPGDVIFTAEYSSSSLSMLEARIWVHRSTLSITPQTFSWGGAFDGAGAGSEYGYANIRPKTAGAFYTGLQSENNTWAGPFKFVDAGNNVLDNYSARQFMEFSVNLTKLGLDPVTMLGGSACGLPFRRILVKSRSSTSFNAELKDFVGPFDFFLAPHVKAAAEVPQVCGATGSSRLMVTNPVSTSVYTWSTLDGNIIGTTTGTETYADRDGTYIVTQQLMDGCGAYASDTVRITFDSTCTLLNGSGLQVNALLRNQEPLVSWKLDVNDKALAYEVQRSTDGLRFQTVFRQEVEQPQQASASFSYHDEGVVLNGQPVFYRIRVLFRNGASTYSGQARLVLPLAEGMRIFPNPASKATALTLTTTKKGMAALQVVALSGAQVFSQQFGVRQGANHIALPQAELWPEGVYLVIVTHGGVIHQQKLLVTRAGGAR